MSKEENRSTYIGVVGEAGRFPLYEDNVHEAGGDEDTAEHQSGFQRFCYKRHHAERRKYQDVKLDQEQWQLNEFIMLLGM